MDEKIILSISRYIDDAMTEEERHGFELLIKHDSEVKTEFDEQKELVDFINSFIRKPALENTSIRVLVMKRLKKIIKNRTKK